MMKLGSLFDGSGGFPLAGVINGIEPVWSSEIEPYPLRVTAARFPNVKQLGDVTKINGAKIEPVDIITFGSPCQDLSVAGNQLGIHKGERSSLFFEAIRIIKEMRERDEMDGRTDVDIRPRWAVWENVPGAFSSNKGADFRAVLEAFASVRDDGLSIPQPKKWNHAGCVVGDGWSVAWRVYDAQFWGVPQRRKRIYLIADFASERAGEILFERESVSGDSSESGKKGQGAAADVEGSAGRSGGTGLTNRGYVTGDKTETLRAESHMALPCVVQPAAFMGGQGAKAGGIGYCDDGTTPTLKASPSGGSENLVCYPAVCYDGYGNECENIAPPLIGDHANRVNFHSAICVGNGQQNITPHKYIVRRLTPLECCRLQGFPDWWEDGVEGSDSARYKMWGNGIALPCAVDVLRRIKEAE